MVEKTPFLVRYTGGDDPFQALKLGRVAHAWNNTHFLIFLTFMGLTRLDMKHAAAIYHSQKADSAQRDMTRDLLLSMAGDYEPDHEIHKLAGRFKDLCKILSSNAGRRNAIVHAHVVFDLQGRIHYNWLVPVKPDSPKSDPFNDVDGFLKELQDMLAEAGSIYEDLAVLFAWPDRGRTQSGQQYFLVADHTEADTPPPPEPSQA